MLPAAVLVCASNLWGGHPCRDILHVLGFKRTLWIIACQSLPIHSALANRCRVIQPLLSSLILVPFVVKVGKYSTEVLSV